MSFRKIFNRKYTYMKRYTEEIVENECKLQKKIFNRNSCICSVILRKRYIDPQHSMLEAKLCRLPIKETNKSGDFSPR